MYSPQRSFRGAANHGNFGAASRNRRPVKVYAAALLAICALALVNTNLFSSSRRSLSEVRKLCKTYFSYGDWNQYWEDLFADKFDYDGKGDRSLLPKDDHNIGYFLTLTSCPGDSYTSGADIAYDPGHAFYDAAALLKYSIFRNTYPVGSAYNATMYALVHPTAVRCKGLNGDEYDRVKVLQDLGYHVSIIGSPIYPALIKDPVVKDSLPDDAGERDFMKLEALTYTNHPAVVLVDFTTLMMKPMDDVFDEFIKDPKMVAKYSMDYADNLPATGSNTGPNMHFLILRPDEGYMKIFLKGYTDSAYTKDKGWEGKGVMDFKGVLGVKGFLQHFFLNVKPGISSTLGRCDYGNDNSNPYAQDVNGKPVCRDPDDCKDCRLVDFEEIKVIKMIHTCGKPWECSFDDSWDSTTKAMCEGFHRSWFKARMDFEESCWHNGPPSYRTGTFYPDIFMGFCTGPGIVGYDRMIDDKPAPGVCDQDTQSNTATEFLKFPSGGGQDQTLVLTTGKVSGSVTACVSGRIGIEGFEPPYNLGIVIDVSGSTGGSFSGTSTGDVNGDGKSNNLLDAELASVIAVLEHIVATPGLDNDNVNIGLTSFSTKATYHGQFTPVDPKDPSAVNPDLLSTLLAMRSGGFTHFDDALDKIILYFEEAPRDRSNILFFLSDGIPNVAGDGDGEEPSQSYYNNNPDALKYDSEIEAMDKLKVKRIAVGVGGGSDVRDGYGLDKIDNTPDPVTGKGPVQVTSTDALTKTLLSSPVAGTIVDFGITVNGVGQGIDASNVVVGPTGMTFGKFVVTGLDPNMGSMNVISATAVIDFDGDTNTGSDQIKLTATNEIPGTLN